jgi:uncharacterized protein YndB with AHSA1/START domain
MTTTSVAPVRKQIVVDAPQARAFRVFTERMELWWPRGHHIGKSPLHKIVLETHVDGRWYEIGEDGAPCDWGRVLAWEPPRRVLLAWQIDGNWQFDPKLVTEVEVRFIAEGANRTRVELEHRDLERFGAAAAAVRESIDSQGGWTEILRLFGEAAAHAPADKRHYLCRLIPPRPSFAADMTEAEARVMQEHVGYWTQKADQGVALVFGPVADPNGAWGVGIIAVDDEAQVDALRAGDPAIRSGLGFRYEVLPMPQLVRRV